MKEELSSSETSVLTRAARRNMPEDTIFHSHRRESLKSYILPSIWTEVLGKPTKASGTVSGPALNVARTEYETEM
jgi:hypothetical protein